MSKSKWVVKVESDVVSEHRTEAAARKAEAAARVDLAGDGYDPELVTVVEIAPESDPLPEVLDIITIAVDLFTRPRPEAPKPEPSWSPKARAERDRTMTALSTFNVDFDF